MFNPINAIKTIGGAVSAAGKVVGTAQKLKDAFEKDADNDGKPEYKNALEGVKEMIDKAKECFGIGHDIVEIFKVKVLPHLRNLFEEARKAVQ